MRVGDKEAETPKEIHVYGLWDEQINFVIFATQCKWLVLKIVVILWSVMAQFIQDRHRENVVHVHHILYH